MIDVGWIKRSVSTRIDGLLNLGGNAALFPPYDFWFRHVRLREKVIAVNPTIFLLSGEKLTSAAPSAMRQQFDRHAQNWHLLGSPLRPCAEDMRIMQKCFGKWHYAYCTSRSNAPLKALLLGVTPEIATQDWGVPADLTAVDISQAMIAAVWPGDTPMSRALCADWMDMPVAGNDFDMLMADGVFTLLNYPAGYEGLAHAVQHCLKRDGLFMLRSFCRPASTESLASIFDDLWNRRIGSFHAFKWRLAMSVHGDDIRRGVAVAEVWKTYHTNVIDHERLAKATGWPVEVIATIDAYRDSPAVYTFPDVDELVNGVAPYLTCVCYETGSYELAERCPLLCFKPR
jgi:hypothetical protein